VGFEPTRIVHTADLKPASLDLSDKDAYIIFSQKRLYKIVFYIFLQVHIPFLFGTDSYFFPSFPTIILLQFSLAG